MAPKRGANGRFKSGGGSVTGGTGDVKPQYMTIVVPAAGAINDYQVALFPLPRLILGHVDTATVMEILSVDWYIAMADSTDASAANFAFLSTRAIRSAGDTSTTATFEADMADPGTFAGVFLVQEFVTTGGKAWTMPIHVDLTDNNGNGVLVAVDAIFATSGSVNNTAITTAIAKVLYRMVNVGITEYVGIVQSQLV